MNPRLAELAPLAEIIASISVVVTLIFVGLQISDANRETRAATLQSAAESEMFLAATLLPHAGTWDKVLSGEPLANGEETRTAIILFNLLIVETESRYQQFNSGYLSAESWEGRRSVLRSLANLPIYSVWRDSPGANGRSAEFLAMLDSLREKTPNE
jgi:hypothetical protein